MESTESAVTHQEPLLDLHRTCRLGNPPSSRAVQPELLGLS